MGGRQQLAAGSPESSDSKTDLADGTHGSSWSQQSSSTLWFHSFVGLFYSSAMWDMCAEKGHKDTDP